MDKKYKLSSKIIKLIEDERVRQAVKWNKSHGWGWGDCSSDCVMPEVKSIVLSEETGEVSRAVLEHNESDLKKELIQVVAVGCAWLENIIKNENKKD